MAEHIAAQAAVLMVPTLGKGANSFRAKLKAELRTVRESVEIDVRANTKRMLAEIEAAKKVAEQDPVVVDVKANIKELTQIRHRYEDLRARFKNGLKLNVAVAGMPLLKQLPVALAAVDKALVDLGQSALMLPGVFASLASSFATLKMGTKGLTNVFAALRSEQDSAIHRARTQRNAQRDLEAATRNLSNAYRDARRNLQDLNDEMRDAPLDEAEAVLRLQEAYQELNNSLGKSALERQKDQLALLRAENNLADVRKKNVRLAQDAADAMAKGVAGSDEVLSAVDRFGKASEAAQYNSDRLADAMANLSPKAREFAEALRGVRQSTSQMSEAVQDRFLDGLGDDVKRLADNYLPMLQSRFVGVAGAMNGTFKSLMGSLGSDSSKGFVDRILGNTAEAQSRLGQAMDPLVDSLLRLSAVGSDLVPRMATGFGDLLMRFDAFIQRAEGDGSLTRWMNNGIQALKDLGNSLINIGSIMNSVAEALSGSGGKGMLELLADSTRRMADMLKGAEGQQRLRDFFYKARQELAMWKPTLKDVWSLLRNVSEAGSQWAKVVLPPLQAISDLLNKYPGILQTILYGWLSWRMISPVISGVNLGMRTLSTVTDAVSGALGAANGKGLVGKVRSLAGLLSPGGILMSGLAVVATAVGSTLADAQAEAERATRQHADAIRNLRSEMNGLSGDITESGLVRQLEELANYEQGQGVRGTFNIPKIAQNLNIPQDKLAKSLVPTQQGVRNEVMDELFEIVRVSVHNSPFWKGHGKRATELGFTPELLAGGLTGDEASLAKIRELSGGKKFLPIGGGPFSLHPEGFTLADIAQGSKLGPHTTLGGMSQKGLDASVAANAIRQRSSLALSEGQDMRARAEAVYGRYELNDAGKAMFGDYGTPRVSPGENGDVLIKVDTPVASLPKQLVADIEHNSGRVEPLADGSLIILNKERAALYTDKIPGHANGGFMTGPGTGRSDSMLARVSNGEFITRASSVAKYGRAFFEALNAGKIDLSALPGFSGGGDPFDKQQRDGRGFIKSPANMPGSMEAKPSLWGRIAHFITDDIPNKLGMAPIRASDWKPKSPQIKMADPFGDRDSAYHKLTHPPTKYGDDALRHDPRSGLLMPGAGPAGPLPQIPGIGGIPKPPAAPAKAPAKPGGSRGVSSGSIAASASSGLTHGAGAGARPGPGNMFTFTHGMGGGRPPGPGAGFRPSVMGRGIPGLGGLPGMGGMPGGGGIPGLGGLGGILGGGRGGGGASPGEVIGMFGSGDILGGISKMPQNIQPQSIAAQLGQIALSSVLGFFGINPEYFNLGQRALSDAMGTGMRGFGGGSGEANPYVDFLMQADPYGLYGGGGMSGVVPYAGLSPGSSVTYGSDGFPDWVYQVGRTFGLQASTYAGHQEKDGANKGIDWSGPVENMQAFAEYLASLGIMEQVIWCNPRTGQKIGVADGELVGPGTSQPQYYGNDWAGHTDHVHTRMSMSIPVPGTFGGSNDGMSSMFGAFDPEGGAEQWRPLVEQRVAAAGLGPQWVDPLIRQIQTESGGNPFSRNDFDSDGKGGRQSVMGLFNFLPSTFQSYGGRDIWNPIDQIDTALRYVPARWGVNSVTGIPNHIGRGVGFANGGILNGAGTGRSDSMLARVSNGEFITRASSVSKYGLPFMRALNEGRIDPKLLRGFSGGGDVQVPIVPGLATPGNGSSPGQSSGQLPSSAPQPQQAPQSGASAATATPQQQAQADQSAPDAMTDPNAGAPDPVTDTASRALEGLSGAFGPGGDPGAEPGVDGTADEQPDPRAILGAAPANMDHNNPALSKGIREGASHAGTLIASALSAAGGSAPAPGAGAAGAFAGQMAQAGAQIAGQAADSAVNILSSFLVGTVTPGSTQSAYGAPVLPNDPVAQSGGGRGPAIVNNYNGGIHTASYDEFYRGQQRREAQQVAPMMPMR